jgi:hypothetical protein
LAQGLAAEVWTQDSSEVLEPQSLAPGQRVVVAEGEMERVVEQLEATHARTEPLADAVELEEQHQVELPGPQPWADLLRLALGEGHVHPGVGGPEAGDRLRHQRRPRGRKGGRPHATAAAGGDRRHLGLGGLDLGQDSADVTGEGSAGGGRSHTAAAPLDQGRANFPLQRGDRLRHRRLRVGEGVRSGRERPVGDDFAKDGETNGI